MSNCVKFKREAVNDDEEENQGLYVAIYIVPYLLIAPRVWLIAVYCG
jgi:hypothetical protein